MVSEKPAGSSHGPMPRDRPCGQQTCVAGGLPLGLPAFLGGRVGRRMAKVVGIWKTGGLAQ